MKRSRDGLYWRDGVLAFRYQDQDGRWREKYTGTADRAEAKKFKLQFEESLRQGTLPTDKAKWTVAQAATLWVDDHAAHLKSAKGRANERSYLRQLLRHLGMKLLQDVGLDDLKRYQRERSRKVRERPINIELQILINVLKEANLWRGSLVHFKRLTEPESEIGQALTMEQLHHLQRVAAGNDAWLVAYCASVLAANTGMRGGEIKKLRLAVIDLENRRIYIRHNATKTKAGRRTVELNQAATEAVTKLYMRAKQLGSSEPEHFLLPADLSRHHQGWGSAERRTRFRSNSAPGVLAYSLGQSAPGGRGAHPR
jgi:integrase